MNKKIDQLAVIVFTDMNAQKTAGTATSGIKAEAISIPESSYQHHGDADAPVEMTIISDLECPYCIKLYDLLFPELEEVFVDRNLVELSYQAYPLESKHPKALPAAEALYCADQQGAFWPLFHELSKNIDKLSPRKISNVPKISGVDSEIFSECVASTEPEDEIHNTVKLLSAAGITGTPSVIINGKKITGFKNFKDISGYIDNQLNIESDVITPDDAQQRIQSGKYQILDVRTLEEFNSGHISEAVNIDFFNSEVFALSIEKLPKDSPWIIYCKSGTRSSRAWHQLRAAGFDDIYNMAEGFDGWSGAGFPVE